ncbi:MAG: HutD family protein [Bacillota bacterium]|nr:HutD family protein [Bacillota bacterium]
MEKHIYKEENFKVNKWSGGSTTELAIYPKQAQYLERDFVWRLSSATVDEEESAFTRLPDYDRVLMVLDGEAVLAHGEERSVSLKAMEQDSFDGAIKTKCFGKIRDYNLMVQKGCSGTLTAITAGAEAKPVDVALQEGFSHASYGIYCTAGYIIASVNGETTMIKEGQQLVLDLETGDECALSIMGEGESIFARIFYNKEAYVPEEIPEAKATFEDFKTAFKLFYTRNRWNQVLKKRRKATVWYDEAMQKKLRFLDKGCITFILWAVVIVVLGILAAMVWTADTFIWMAVIWTALHLLLIAPMIYTLVLPKPIKAHIKDVENLTEYEQKLYEQQQEENPEAEKVLKKYKMTANDEYKRNYESKLKKLWK